MRKSGGMFTVALCALLLAGGAWAAPEFQSEQEKDSYAIGANLARRLKQQGFSIDPAQVSRGVVDAWHGASLLTDAEIDGRLRTLQEAARQKQQAEHRQAAEANRARGTAFLAEHAGQEGVKILPGGVQYRVLQAGSGTKPAGDDIVLCHYRGRLVDGTVFDASPPGKPAAFTLTKVIAGWREALGEMPVGSKWEIVIPAEKGYGERGAAPAIGPNETLIFEVELVGIE